MTAILLALMMPAQAQVNVEPIAAAASAPGWGFTWAGGLGVAAGNTSYVDLSTQSSVYFSTPLDADDPESTDFRDRIILNGNLASRRYDSGKVLDNRFVHLRYTRMQSHHLGFDVFGQVGNDRLLLQNWRILGGLGPRAVLVDTERAGLWLGSGYMIEWEDRAIGDEATDPRFELDHRWTTYITVRLDLLEDRLALVNTAYVQPRFDNFADVQLLDDLQLQITLTDALKWTTSLYLRYDSAPPSELAAGDLRLSNGLKLSL